MSNNAYIAYTNLADSAILLTASASSLLLPVSNLLVPHIARKWRGIDTVTDYFVSDLGSLTSIDTLAVFGITGSQIRFRISSVDATGAAGDLYDSGTLSVDQNYKSSINIIPNAVSGRYVRVDLTTAAGTYVEAGRLFIGTRTQFSYNYVKGWHRLWTDRSTKTKTRGGQTQIFADVTYRSIDVTFDFLTQNDRDGFVETIDRVNATKTDVLFVTNPASANLSRDSIWGLITSMTPVVQPYVSTFSKQYMIEERL
jgi:hypothetical protein